ncbi:MAG: hypothetical protein JWM38_2221 [Sphingomonas bacterium]|jgi:uncharacterized protein (TIGR02118 family)|nr:hypothetical protein [Sphingomonas bacterium]
MHRILALYGVPSDPEHFRSYYTGTHLKLAARLPGLRAMHYSFDVAAISPGNGFFCVWSGEFDDAAAAAAAMQSPEGEALAADVGNYASGGVTLVQYTDAAA